MNQSSGGDSGNLALRGLEGASEMRLVVAKDGPFGPLPRAPSRATLAHIVV
jgi:hypothetical protein